MVRFAPAIAVTVASILASTVFLPVAQAAEPSWQIGQCFNLTPEELKETTIPADAIAVPCTSGHNIEVTYAGVIDVSTPNKKSKAVRSHCSASSQYTYAGLALSKQLKTNEGALPRLGRFAWTTSDGEGLVCAAFISVFAKPGVAGTQTLGAPLKSLVMQEGNAVSMDVGACYTSVSAGKVKSISCDPTKWKSSAWMLTKIVNAQAKFGTNYPGDSGIRKFAQAQCGAGLEAADIPWYALWSDRNSWVNGGDLVYCLRRAGL